MKIPIAIPYLNEDEVEAAAAVIRSGWLTQGPKVAEFEEAFAKYTGAKHAVAVSSCTTGLHLAMIVAGIGPGDEVICPSLSYIATANSIRYAGATPVFAEIDPLTYNLDVTDVSVRITSRTKAVLVVHQMGLPSDIDAFCDLCKQHGLALIEDAACAAGSSYKGAKIGSHSDLVCFSFHPRKVITTGDGGMITTGRKDYCERLKILRQHGMSVNDRVRHESSTVIIPDHVELGYNYRMTDVQAAIGIKQLEKLDWLVQERRKIAHTYLDAFSGIDNIQLPIEPVECISNYQSFPVYLKPGAPDRNLLMQILLEAGISTRSGIMTSHRETAYADLCKGVSLPVSEEACDRSILLPLYIPMKTEQIDFVVNKFVDLLR